MRVEAERRKRVARRYRRVFRGPFKDGGGENLSMLMVASKLQQKARSIGTRIQQGSGQLLYIDSTGNCQLIKVCVLALGLCCAGHPDSGFLSNAPGFDLPQSRNFQDM
jgi:hypothetical protein